METTWLGRSCSCICGRMMDANPNEASRVESKSSLFKLLILWSTPFVCGLAGLSSLLLLITAVIWNSKFTIENGLDHTVLVTPIGVLHNSSDHQPLPLHRDFRLFKLLRKFDGGFRLAPGDSIRLAYDDDDVGLSEILVDNEKGNPLGQLDIANASHNANYRLENASLTPATASVLNAAMQAKQPLHLTLAFNALLLVGWPLIMVQGVLKDWTARRNGPSELSPTNDK